MNPQYSPHAHKIAGAFDRGASTYDRHARVQYAIAQLLQERLAAFVDDAPIQRIVDLGCGTGSFTKDLALRYPHAAFVACDISQAMVDKTKQTLTGISKPGEDRRFSVIRTDAELATFAPAPDLAVSNLAMQWFADPLAAIAHHSRRARFLAWTTLVEGTFATWITAHESRGIAHGLRNFVDVAGIVATCERLAPVRLQCMVDQVDEHFPDAMAFLRDLRLLGATTARPEHHPIPLRGILRSFENGFTAEYRVCTILIESQPH